MIQGGSAVKLFWKSEWDITHIVEYQKACAENDTKDSRVKECKPLTHNQLQYPKGSSISSSFTTVSWIQAGAGVKDVPEFLFCFV